MLQYATYRLTIREDLEDVCESRGHKVTFHSTKSNKSCLSEVYNNLTDYLESNLNASNFGRTVILPSSFNGSPRNMYQNYLDAISIVQHSKKPSLFITMICNPSWLEIVSNIGVGDSATFRPDIAVRVFKSKLKALIEGLTLKHIFGKVQALIFTIEFQKGGLPHTHILLSLNEQDKIVNATDIDKVVSAEIPNIQTHPTLHESCT